MRNTCFQKATFVISLSLILFLIALTGCGNNDNNTDAEDVPEYVFVPEFTSLSALANDLPNMDDFVLAEDSLYFTSTIGMSSYSFFHATQIFRIDLSESELMLLENYTVGTRPTDAEGGGVRIEGIQLDSDGNLWVAETAFYMTFDFPSDFNIEEAGLSGIWGYSIPLETANTVRKLDNTGAEVLSINLNHLENSPTDWAGFSAFYVDNESNIFVGSGQTIYVLDTEGQLLFTLNTDGLINQDSIISLSDGRVVYSSWHAGMGAQILHVVDMQNGAWGEIIDLNMSVTGIFRGNDEYLVLINCGTYLWGIEDETGEMIQLLNWADSGIAPVGLDNIVLLPNDHIMLTATGVHGGEGARTELVVLSITPLAYIPDVTTITIATIDPRSISGAVVQFNRINQLYQIEIIDIHYSTFGGTHQSNLDRLILDIMAGRGPDIIHTSAFPFHQWAGRGLFADLYEFIDADPTLSRSDLMENVFRNSELNGSLYQIFPFFSVNTLIGHPDIVGSEPGWSFEEFKAVIEANPQATAPFYRFFGGYSLIFSIFNNNIEAFVCWETRTTNFDNDFFIALLEYAYELESLIDLDADGIDTFLFRMISSGETIMYPTNIWDFRSYAIYQDLFGGDFVFKGFPSEAGSGNSLDIREGLAISSMSENQQGAWEFLRMFLTEDWQRRNNFGSLPTNRYHFDEVVAEVMAEWDESVSGPSAFTWGDLPTAFRALTQNEVDNVLELIDSAVGVTSLVNPLADIMRESIADFFAGAITAQDAARIIQNRALIFVAEQI